MQRIPGAELSSRVALQNCWSLCLWHLTGRWKDRSPLCTQGFGCSQSISGHITPSPKLTFPLWSNQVTLRVVLDDFAPYWPKTYFTDNAKQWMSSSHCLYTAQLSYSHNIWLHCMLLPLLYLKKKIMKSIAYIDQQGRLLQGQGVQRYFLSWLLCSLLVMTFWLMWVLN